MPLQLSQLPPNKLKELKDALHLVDLEITGDEIKEKNGSRVLDDAEIEQLFEARINDQKNVQKRIEQIVGPAATLDLKNGIPTNVTNPHRQDYDNAKSKETALTAGKDKVTTILDDLVATNQASKNPSKPPQPAPNSNSTVDQATKNTINRYKTKVIDLRKAKTDTQTRVDNINSQRTNVLQNMAAAAYPRGSQGIGGILVLFAFGYNRKWQELLDKLDTEFAKAQDKLVRITNNEKYYNDRLTTLNAQAGITGGNGNNPTNTGSNITPVVPQNPQPSVDINPITSTPISQPGGTTPASSVTLSPTKILQNAAGTAPNGFNSNEGIGFAIVPDENTATQVIADVQAEDPTARVVAVQKGGKTLNLSAGSTSLVTDSTNSLTLAAAAAIETEPTLNNNNNTPTLTHSS